MTSSHLSGRNEMCFIRGTVDIPHSRHSRYGDAASYDRVCLALPRLCDPDPVAPAFGGLELLGHLSILFHLTLISHPSRFYLPGLGILVFDRVQIRSRARARRRHLAIYS
ncbi:hypothetical protein Syun_001669 [Stephania yunnanensis]|uniref:Uncharacterized protein n=1 Tax=Stephania yunnanensis TaxID=152371 RepID=A0AAP0LIA2_9MAGN